MSEPLDPFEDVDEFQDDPDTKAVLAMIDGVISKRTAQDAYDWLCDLESKIEDRVDPLVADPNVKG
jgi:hypothetical protein